jgi:small subunit ribosomal protein S19
MSRSKWKGPFIDLEGFENIKQAKTRKEKKVFTMPRNSEILPAFIGLTFNVYNGKSYSEITVNESMISHKFGEFCFTRVKYVFKKKKLKK